MQHISSQVSSSFPHFDPNEFESVDEQLRQQSNMISALKRDIKRLSKSESIALLKLKEFNELEQFSPIMDFERESKLIELQQQHKTVGTDQPQNYTILKHLLAKAYFVTITFSSKRFGPLSPNDVHDCDNRLLYALLLMHDCGYIIESYSCFEVGSKGNPHGHSVMIFYDEPRRQLCEAHLNRIFNHTTSKLNKYCIKFLPAHETQAVKYLNKTDTPDKVGHYFIKIGEAWEQSQTQLNYYSSSI